MRKLASATAIALVAVVLLVTFAVSRARHNTREARVVLNQFYTTLQAQDYHSAHALLTSRFADAMTEPALHQRWQAFEQVHGRVTHWSPTHDDNRSGSAAGMIPPFVDFTYKVWGAKGTCGFAVVRLVPDSGTWHVDKLNVIV